MARLVTFLNEKNDEQVFELIKKNCKPYFKRFKRDRLLLYSGRKKTQDWFEGTIRKDRTPLDMPKEVHDIANKHFKKKFGAPLRSECLFAYALLGYTSHYGNPYIILPIGDFDIYWHPQVIDFYGDLDEKVDKWFGIAGLGYLKMREINYALADKIVEFVNDEIEELVNGYVKNKKPARMDLEVMIHGNKYYALATNWVHPNNYRDKLWEIFNEA